MLPTFLLANNSNKKVAVVLSGGGAKGVAHVGALKIIEEVGISIDYIIGTSIGAIVGGLYAIGYTPQQLDSIVRHNDWMALITDEIERNEIPFPYKDNDEKFIITLSLDKERSKGGFLEGQSISNLLNELTKNINDSISFDSLPIAFACVATDMVNNKKEVIRSGNLVEAMRASMGIPLIFTPVRKGGKILIDGGFKDNLAIEVAKDMGADYIIAIDAQSELADEEHLQSIPDMLNQLMLMICQSELDDKLKDVDVYIKVDVNGFTAASFGKEALNTLIDRGEIAARRHIEFLEDIKEQTTFNPSVNRNTLLKENIGKENTISQSLSIEKKLNVGLRFDSEYIAAILINANLQNSKGTGFDFTLRAGKQSYIEANYIFQTSNKQSLSINNKISYYDIFLYNRGNKQYNPTYLNQEFGLNYSRNIKKNFLFQVGANIDYHKLINSLPKEKLLLDKHCAYMRYYSQIEYESLNSLYYPTSGTKIKAGYNFYKSINSHPSFYTFDFHIQKVFSITKETTLIPILFSRYVSKKNIPFIYNNAIGGVMQGRYFNHQLPFVGINHVEKGKPFLTIAQVSVNQKISEKHYLKFIGNFGVNTNCIPHFFKNEKLYGGGIGYSYNSLIGPIELFISCSNRTCLGWFLNVGFDF